MTLDYDTVMTFPIVLLEKLHVNFENHSIVKKEATSSNPSNDSDREQKCSNSKNSGFKKLNNKRKKRKRLKACRTSHTSSVADNLLAISHNTTVVENTSEKVAVKTVVQKKRESKFKPYASTCASINLKPTEKCLSSLSKPIVVLERLSTIPNKLTSSESNENSASHSDVHDSCNKAPHLDAGSIQKIASGSNHSTPALCNESPTNKNENVMIKTLSIVLSNCQTKDKVNQKSKPVTETVKQECIKDDVEKNIVENVCQKKMVVDMKSKQVVKEIETKMNEKLDKEEVDRQGEWKVQKPQSLAESGRIPNVPRVKLQIVITKSERQERCKPLQPKMSDVIISKIEVSKEKKQELVDPMKKSISNEPILKKVSNEKLTIPNNAKTSSPYLKKDTDTMRVEGKKLERVVKNPAPVKAVPEGERLKKLSEQDRKEEVVEKPVKKKRLRQGAKPVKLKKLQEDETNRGDESKKLKNAAENKQLIKKLPREDEKKNFEIQRLENEADEQRLKKLRQEENKIRVERDILRKLAELDNLKRLQEEEERRRMEEEELVKNAERERLKKLREAIEKDRLERERLAEIAEQERLKKLQEEREKRLLEEEKLREEAERERKEKTEEEKRRLEEQVQREAELARLRKLQEEEEKRRIEEEKMTREAELARLKQLEKEEKERQLEEEELKKEAELARFKKLKEKEEKKRTEEENLEKEAELARLKKLQEEEERKRLEKEKLEKEAELAQLKKLKEEEKKRRLEEEKLKEEAELARLKKLQEEEQRKRLEEENRRVEEEKIKKEAEIARLKELQEEEERKRREEVRLKKEAELARLKKLKEEEEERRVKEEKIKKEAEISRLKKLQEEEERKRLEEEKLKKEAEIARLKKLKEEEEKRRVEEEKIEKEAELARSKKLEEEEEKRRLEEEKRKKEVEMALLKKLKEEEGKRRIEEEKLKKEAELAQLKKLKEKQEKRRFREEKMKKKAELARLKELEEEDRKKRVEEERIQKEAELVRLKKLQEEEEKRRIEEEQIRKEAELARLQKLQEEEEKRRVEEERIKKEAELARLEKLREEEEKEKKRLEEEKLRKEAESAQSKKLEEEKENKRQEKQRLDEIAENERLINLQEEKERRRLELEIIKKEAELKRLRKIKEEEKKRVEGERRKKEAEILRLKKLQEEEEKRRIDEEKIKKQAEVDRLNKFQQEEEEKKRLEEKRLSELGAELECKKKLQAEEEKMRLLGEKKLKIMSEQEKLKELQEKEKRPSEEQEEEIENEAEPERLENLKEKEKKRVGYEKLAKVTERERLDELEHHKEREEYEVERPLKIVKLGQEGKSKPEEPKRGAEEIMLTKLHVQKENTNEEEDFARKVIEIEKRIAEDARLQRIAEEERVREIIHTEKLKILAEQESLKKCIEEERAKNPLEKEKSRRVTEQTILNKISEGRREKIASKVREILTDTDRRSETRKTDQPARPIINEKEKTENPKEQQPLIDESFAIKTEPIDEYEGTVNHNFSSDLQNGGSTNQHDKENNFSNLLNVVSSIKTESIDNPEDECRNGSMTLQEACEQIRNNAILGTYDENFANTSLCVNGLDSLLSIPNYSDDEQSEPDDVIERVDQHEINPNQHNFSSNLNVSTALANMYNCIKCGQFFRSERSLRDHTRCCMVPPYLQCVFCFWKTNRKNTLRKHIKAKHKNDCPPMRLEPLLIEIFRKSAPLRAIAERAALLDNTLLQDARRLTLKCDECYETFATKARLQKHIFRRHWTMPVPVETTTSTETEFVEEEDYSGENDYEDGMDQKFIPEVITTEDPLGDVPDENYDELDSGDTEMPPLSSAPSTVVEKTYGFVLPQKTQNFIAKSVKTWCPVCDEWKTAVEKFIKCQSCETPYIYVCKWCPQQKRNYQMLRVHVIRHHTERIHTCGFCGHSFSYIQDYRHHLRFCNKEKNISCPNAKCLFKTKYKRSLKHHLSKCRSGNNIRYMDSTVLPKSQPYIIPPNTLIHSSVPNYVPMRNGEDTMVSRNKLKSEGNCVSQRKRHSDPGVLTENPIPRKQRRVLEPIPKLKFYYKKNGLENWTRVRPSSKSKRLKKAKTGKKYTCFKCGRSYNTNSQLSRHMSCCSKVNMLVSCDHCSFKTVSKATLVAHIHSKHAARLFRGIEAFSCANCRQVFRNYFIYERHAAKCKKARF